MTHKAAWYKCKPMVLISHASRTIAMHLFAWAQPQHHSIDRRLGAHQRAIEWRTDEWLFILPHSEISISTSNTHIKSRWVKLHNRSTEISLWFICFHWCTSEESSAKRREYLWTTSVCKRTYFQISYCWSLNWVKNKIWWILLFILIYWSS